MSIKSAAIVVAAGQGLRFGGLKQLESMGNKRIIDYALSRARSSVDYVVCVKTPAVEFGHLDADMVVDGGATRSESVRAGLAVIPKNVSLILIHDAARPLATGELFKKVIAALLDGAMAVVPVTPITDTIKEVIGNQVVATLDRSRLFAAQTPQGFQRKVLELAHSSGQDATDDCHLVEMIGVQVQVIMGERFNMKVTSPDDLDRIKLFLEGKQSDGSS